MSVKVFKGLTPNLHVHVFRPMHAAHQVLQDILPKMTKNVTESLNL